jgi:molybdopterin synthase catalytic subunit
MRKISREVISAFLAGKPKRNGNTTTDGKVLRLYGNTIADKSIAGSIYIYDGGVRSATTKERLNALLQLMKYENYEMVADCIFQKNYEWLVRYNNGEKTNFQNGIVLGVKK